ncbi:protein kinase activating protein dpb11 [Friedmanniomyces endolithicus]|nr:protein kinase activating protein dpb11 [Friedmanniomyces endolithicus]
MAQGVDNHVSERLPLQGVVLCCTALPQDVRLSLPDVASRMGATFRLDLTTDVTHLIVGSITTPKYRYVAKSRPDIKVVSIDWLEAVRQAYMKGDDVDVVELEEEHKLGVFHGLQICVTGFDNLEKRTFLSEAVVRQGAEYHGDLTKAVTHLIAAAPTGAKYTHAKAWKIHIVSWKWFKDSLERGMALEESLYDPMLTEEEQGQGAIATVKAKISPGKRTRDSESQATSDTRSRKLRRTASTRLHGQSQDMWQDLSTRDDASETLATNQWKEEVAPTYAPQKRTSEEKVQVRQSGASVAEPVAVPDGVFSGCFVLVRGFPRDRASRLQLFLEPQGAMVVKTVKQLEESSLNPAFRAGYLLVPHAFDGSHMEPPDVPEGTKTVTEWWVERCIHTKKLIDSANDVLSRPLWQAKIADFAGLSICTTGFSGVDFRQTAEAIRLMGADYTEKLVPSVSVLISGSEVVKEEKAYYAAKHRVSVVSVNWLWECIRLQRKLEYAGFAVEIPAFRAKETIEERSDAGSASSGVRQSKAGGPVKQPDGVPKRLSNTRHRPATPSLSLQATTSAPPRPRRNAGPFIHEDDDDDTPAAVDKPLLELITVPKPELTRSQPLQEIEPNASPRMHDQNDGTTDDSAELKTPKTFSPKRVALPTSPKSPHSLSAPEPGPPPPPRPPQDLTADIAALLHHQTASRSAEPHDPAPPRLKRKNRPLGRSTSGIGSTRTLSASAPSDTPSMPPEQATGSAADGYTNFSSKVGAGTLPPSCTQLGYETADAEAHRSVMEKQMKVCLVDESSGVRVASVGTVKDSFVAGGEGVGNRVRGRNRGKGL